MCLGKLSLWLPEVNHAQTTTFPFVLKCLGLWLTGEQ